MLTSITILHSILTLAIGPTIGLGILLILVIAAVFIIVALWLKKSGKGVLAEFEVEHPGEKILHKDGANFFGLQSKGMGQVRGNGLLILTKRKLYFRQFVPAKWFEIPLAWISSLAHPRSFLGKSKGMKLLVVNYTNQEGAADAIGWAVNDLDKWSELITSKRGKT